MILNNGMYIADAAIAANLKKLTNQIYKLLPNREEKEDWITPLTTIIEELRGMDRLVDDYETLFALLCKLEGLFTLTNDEDFFLYRRTIFECLNLITTLKEEIICQQ